MRYIVIGNGNVGKKRRAVLGAKCVAVVDPFDKSVDYPDCRNVPLDTFDAAVLAIPNNVKIEILEYLLVNKKSAIVEKPFFFKDRHVAERLNALAKANDRIWYTSYNHRFEPLIVKLKEMLKDGLIGQLYFAKLVYGNGTVKNIANTWRDVGSGVLEDLGCHLIDLVSFLFHDREHKFKLTWAHNYEAKTWDYCLFSTVKGDMQFTCSTLVWKNTFTIDIYGSKGSLHLDGLNKWGGTTLIYRERVFPSGVPKEKVEKTSGFDITWAKDIEHFEKLVSSGETSCRNDLYISESIQSLMRQ